MATVNISSNGYTRIYTSISGLTYPDGSYGGFQFDLYKWSGSSWSRSQSTGIIGVNSKTFITDPNAYYYVKGWAQYDSTWYEIGISAQHLLNAIPRPVITYSSSSNSTIIFTTYLAFGIRATQWWGSTNNVNFQWYDLSVIKATYKYDPGGNWFYFNYITSGSQITFLNLAPSQGQLYRVRATYDGYYSDAADNSGSGYLVYSTLGAPPILSSNAVSNITLNSARSTPTGISGGSYNMVDWEWGVYGAGYTGSYSAYAGYHDIYGLIPGTQYDIRCRLRNTVSGYTSSWRHVYPYTLSLTTPSVPIGITANISSGTTIALSYQWGANATSMDLRWGTNGYSWTATYSGQVTNNYPSINYWIDTGSIGDKYFQVRSRRYESGYTTYSAWTNATPYPRNIPYINPRPSNWAWTTTVITGGSIVVDNANKRLKPLTAVEWNAFTTLINAFRVYKGTYNWPFTHVYINTHMTATIVNQARNAILAMSPPTTTPYEVSAGDKVTSNFFNALKNSLNSIL